MTRWRLIVIEVYPIQLMCIGATSATTLMRIQRTTTISQPHLARTHARLEPKMTLTCHVWRTDIYDTRPKFSRLRITTESQLGERHDHISNHDESQLEEWLRPRILYLRYILPWSAYTDQKTYLPQTNHRRKGIGVTHVRYNGPAYI